MTASTFFGVRGYPLGVATALTKAACCRQFAMWPQIRAKPIASVERLSATTAASRLTESDSNTQRVPYAFQIGRRVRACVSPVLRLLVFTLTAAVIASASWAQTIAVGSKKFTESYVLGEIARKLLQDNGIKAEHRQGLGGTVIVWQALLHGDIAMYPEYTGTISEEILKVKGGMTPAAMRDALGKQGVGMTNDLGFNDGYSLVMRQDVAERLGIRTISDLRKHPELRAGPTPEFLGRQDGWK